MLRWVLSFSHQCSSTAKKHWCIYIIFHDGYFRSHTNVTAQPTNIGVHISYVQILSLSGIACWWSAGLVIERLRARIQAGAAGELSSPKSTLCADWYSVSVPPHVTAVARKRPRSLWQKYRWQVTPKHAYTFVPMKSEWADYAVQTNVGT